MCLKTICAAATSHFLIAHDQIDELMTLSAIQTDSQELKIPNHVMPGQPTTLTSFYLRTLKVTVFPDRSSNPI